MLAILGAQLELTPREKGINGSIARAEELLKEIPNSFMPQQFQNPANPAVHKRTTAEEIWKDCDGKLDFFVAGVGTGGTITGVGETLKPRLPGLKVIAVEPALSPVLSGGKHSPHPIQGIGAGFVPDILDRKVIDEVVQIDNESAFKAAAAAPKLGPPGEEFLPPIQPFPAGPAPYHQGARRTGERAAGASYGAPSTGGPNPSCGRFVGTCRGQVVCVHDVRWSRARSEDFATCHRR